MVLVSGSRKENGKVRSGDFVEEKALLRCKMVQM